MCVEMPLSLADPAGGFSSPPRIDPWRAGSTHAAGNQRHLCQSLRHLGPVCRGGTRGFTSVSPGKLKLVPHEDPLFLCGVRWSERWVRGRPDRCYCWGWEDASPGPVDWGVGTESREQELGLKVSAKGTATPLAMAQGCAIGPGAWPPLPASSYEGKALALQPCKLPVSFSLSPGVGRGGGGLWWLSALHTHQ